MKNYIPEIQGRPKTENVTHSIIKQPLLSALVDLKT